MEDSELLGQRIKELRRHRELSQEELAEAIDISTNYLSSLERGVGNPTFSMLVRVAGALEVDVPDLFNYRVSELSEKEIRTRIQGVMKQASYEELQEILLAINSKLGPS